MIPTKMTGVAIDSPKIPQGTYALGHGCQLIVVPNGMALGGLDLGFGQAINHVVESALLAAAGSEHTTDGLALIKDMLDTISDAVTNNAEELEVSGPSIEMLRTDMMLSVKRLTQSLEPQDETESSGFDPFRCFDSVQEAADYCAQQPDPQVAAAEIVVANMKMGEYGFASELVTAAEMIGYGDKKEEDENPNTNCLEGMRCPQCKQHEKLTIRAESTFTVVDDGTEDHGDVDWDEESRCGCPDCGWSGRVKDTRERPKA